MNNNIFIDPALKALSKTIPKESRLKWLVEHCEDPINESQLSRIYETLFEKKFEFSNFNCNNIIELVASTPGIHCKHIDNSYYICKDPNPIDYQLPV